MRGTGAAAAREGSARFVAVGGRDLAACSRTRKRRRPLRALLGRAADTEPRRPAHPSTGVPCAAAAAPCGRPGAGTRGAERGWAPSLPRYRFSPSRHQCVQPRVQRSASRARARAEAMWQRAPAGDIGCLASLGGVASLVGGRCRTRRACPPHLRCPVWHAACKPYQRPRARLLEAAAGARGGGPGRRPGTTGASSGRGWLAAPLTEGVGAAVALPLAVAPARLPWPLSHWDGHVVIFGKTRGSTLCETVSRVGRAR